MTEKEADHGSEPGSGLDVPRFEGLDDRKLAATDGTVARVTVARALRDASAIDSAAVARALRDASAIDSAAVARALREVSRHPQVAPEKLVSEDTLEESVDDEPEESIPAAAAGDVPHDFKELKGALEMQGFTPELRDLSGVRDGFQLAFDLKAGRSTRVVVIRSAEAARVLLGTDVSAWRSLQRYDGIWSQAEGVIEVALRAERYGAPIQVVLSRLGIAPTETDDNAASSGLDLTDTKSAIALRVGLASGVASVLLSSSSWSSYGLRRIMTLRLSNVAVATSEDADNLAERVLDAVSIDLDVAMGVMLMPRRLENRDVARSRSTRRTGRLVFPRNAYPHAPVLLYQAGRDRSTAPLIRYWSYYQVLEYFFPKYSQAEVLLRLSRHLRSPAFDPHRDEDVLKAVHLATGARRGSGSEEEQLLTTLQAITTASEIIDVASSSGMRVQLEDKKSELTGKVLKLNMEADLISQLGERIYDIRCRIAHSKSASQRDIGPGLLPGTHHDDLVRDELPLMEYLAQQALVGAAEPLAVAQRGASS